MRLIAIPKTTGKRSATSISKIRNTTASKKNRIEKGKRAESLGSKPHSKGVALLRAIVKRLPVIILTKSKNKPNIMLVQICAVKIVIVVE